MILQYYLKRALVVVYWWFPNVEGEAKPLVIKLLSCRTNFQFKFKIHPLLTLDLLNQFLLHQPAQCFVYCLFLLVFFLYLYTVPSWSRQQIVFPPHCCLLFAQRKLV